MAMAKPSRFKPFSPPPLPPKPCSNYSPGTSDHSRSPSGPLNDLDIVGSCVGAPPLPPNRHTSVHKSRLERSTTVDVATGQVDKAVQADVILPSPLQSSILSYRNTAASSYPGGIASNNLCSLGFSSHPNSCGASVNGDLSMVGRQCQHHSGTVTASSALSLHSHCCCRLDIVSCTAVGGAASNGHSTAGCNSASAACYCNAIILPCCAFNNLHINNHHQRPQCARCVSHEVSDSPQRPSNSLVNCPNSNSSCSHPCGVEVNSSLSLPSRSKTPPARVSHLDHSKEKPRTTKNQPDIVTSHDNSLLGVNRPSSATTSKRSRLSRALAKFLPSSSNNATTTSTNNNNTTAGSSIVSSANQSFNHSHQAHPHDQISGQSTSPNQLVSTSRRSRSLNRFKTIFQFTASCTNSITTTTTISTATASQQQSISVVSPSVITTDKRQCHNQSTTTTTTGDYTVMTPPHNPPPRLHHHSRSQPPVAVTSRQKPVRSSAPNSNHTTTHATQVSQCVVNRGALPPPRRSSNLPASGADSGSSSSSSPIQSHRVVHPSAIAPLGNGSQTGSDSSMASSSNCQVEHPPAVAASFTESMRRIKRMAWYWGPLSTDEADSLLNTRPNGTFLVRDSAHDSYILSVSFRARGKTYHARVEHTRGKQISKSCLENNGMEAYIVAAIEQSTRSNLGLIVDDSESLRVSLIYPLSRNQDVQSLQHLCRFEILCSVRHDRINCLNLPKPLLAYLKQKQYFAEFIDDLTNKNSP